jgi:hypothetical protein
MRIRRVAAVLADEFIRSPCHISNLHACRCLHRAFHDDFSAPFGLVNAAANPVLKAAMPVARRTHENFAPLVQLDLEGQIPQQRIADDSGPVHGITSTSGAFMLDHLMLEISIML